LLLKAEKVNKNWEKGKNRHAEISGKIRQNDGGDNFRPSQFTRDGA
jgi:hypothetical protein